MLNRKLNKTLPKKRVKSTPKKLGGKIIQNNFFATFFKDGESP